MLRPRSPTSTSPVKCSRLPAAATRPLARSIRRALASGRYPAVRVRREREHRLAFSRSGNKRNYLILSQDVQARRADRVLAGPVRARFRCTFGAGLEGRHSAQRVEAAAWTVSPFQGCCGKVSLRSGGSHRRQTLCLPSGHHPHATLAAIVAPSSKPSASEVSCTQLIGVVVQAAFRSHWCTSNIQRRSPPKEPRVVRSVGFVFH